MTSNIEQQFLGLVEQLIVASGGGAAIAYVIFRFLGKSWIENQLAKDLEIAKSEISMLATRRMKLHDREYIVFPELWSKLNNAFDSFDQAISLLRETPDFQIMGDNNLKDWLNHSDLSDNEKSYFAEERDKGRAYSKILERRDLLVAYKEFREFHKYLQSNRIFLSPEIKEKFDQIDGLIQESLTAKMMDLNGYSDANNNFLLEALNKFTKQVKPLKVDIESLVQARLFPESRTGKNNKVKR
jgi:hypothetical protein